MKPIKPCGAVVNDIQPGEFVRVCNRDAHHADADNYWAARTKGGIALMFTEHEMRRAMARPARERNLQDMPPAKRKTILRRVDKAISRIAGRKSMSI